MAGLPRSNTSGILQAQAITPSKKSCLKFCGGSQRKAEVYGRWIPNSGSTPFGVSMGFDTVPFVRPLVAAFGLVCGVTEVSI